MKAAATTDGGPWFSLAPLGETAVLVEFGQEISPQLQGRVRDFISLLEARPFPGLCECIAAFASVTVFYEPVQALAGLPLAGDGLPYDRVAAYLTSLLERLRAGAAAEPRLVEIPVCYGGECGPDLDFVAAQTGLSPQEVVDLHAAGRYLVYMIGFAPAFPYLGGLSPRLATPRRVSPRTEIPAGSVGIAGMQTGVYPIATPGGWQLIGRTPLTLFRPRQQPPSLLQAGDVVRFRAISPAQYRAYKEEEP